MKIHSNYSLRHLNTFGIESVARQFAEAQTAEEVRECLSLEACKTLPKFILGGGSNLLFTKPELNAFVIKNNIRGIRLLREDKDHVYVQSGAGENWHSFVLHCIANNYAGLENLSLIPGNAGAGPMQNIGAYGVELKDVFYELEAIHKKELTLRTFNREECRFGYRESVFKKALKDEYVITSVTFRLNKIPHFNVSYGAIEKELERMGIQELSIAAVSQAVIHIRQSKLPDPAVIGNAGSFFKNPEIPSEQYKSLQTRFPEMVAYPLDNGHVKLAAGWLIEQCGWKGKTVGDAGVHKLQALVLVNCGNATGKEIYDLSEQVLNSVNQKFGVTLEREVNII
jgi:UDP-N-acetylmuramate dehydrogenase